MAKLYRPHIPLSIRVQVAERQIEALTKCLPTNELGVPYRDDPGRSFAARLAWDLAILSAVLGCKAEDLRLDHDPPLGARPQERRGLGRKTYYIPDANDPEHLRYRPHGAQFDGSHDIKTRVRGDHGQLSDLSLIKRERRRQRREQPTSFQKKMAKLKQERRKRDKAIRLRNKEIRRKLRKARR